MTLAFLSLIFSSFKGGRHVDYIVNQVVEKLKEEIDRRTNVFKSVRSEQVFIFKIF